MKSSRYQFDGIVPDYRADYDLLCRQLQSLMEGVASDVTILSNASALLYQTLPKLNWAGFYMASGDELMLGPFQGKTACVRIPRGRGVCGAAAEKDRTVVVENIHEFAGHIACDRDSRSEIVIPVHLDGRLYGVLDVDSPVLNRFRSADREGLERFVSVLEEGLISE